MRYPILLLLGFAILGQSFVRTAWALDYQINRWAYLEQCENQDKPDMHCDGKCYLKKRMTAQEQPKPKEPELPAGFREIKDLQLFFEVATLLSPLPDVPEVGNIFPPFGASLPDAPRRAIFKPPAAHA
jgi:hypothetical protein